VAAREALAAQRNAHQARLSTLLEQAAISPAAALRTFFGESFAGPAVDEVLARVERVTVDGDLLLALRGGATMRWSPAVARGREGPEGLFNQVSHGWLYVDAAALARNDHCLFFGPDAGPPEGDAELDGTEYEGAEVDWFLEESAWDCFWFSPSDGVARWYEFDGGLRGEPYHGTRTELVMQRILRALGDEKKTGLEA
jgi:hypothetical protein